MYPYRSSVLSWRRPVPSSKMASTKLSLRPSISPCAICRYQSARFAASSVRGLPLGGVRAQRLFTGGS